MKPRLARWMDDATARMRAATIVTPIALVTLAYIVIALVLTWPLAMHLNGGVTSSIDPVDSIWRIGWGHYRLLNNPPQLFDGNTFYPFSGTYLYDELLLGATVLTLPLALLHLSPLLIYNLGVLVSLVFSALAMYALARHFGAARVAAFVSGIIYAFAPMHLDHIGHLGLLSSQWFPLIVLFCDRLVTSPRPRNAVALAVCLAMQTYSSQYYAMYLLILVPLFVVMVVARRPEARRRDVWVYLALAGALAVIVVAPVAIGYRRVQAEFGVERTFGQVTHYSTALTNFFTADSRNRLWGAITSPLRTQGRYTFERNMFPGILALVLAAVGLWVGRRRATEQFFAVLALVSAALAVGPELRITPDSKSLVLRHLPYDLLYWHLPGWDSMRVPGRFGTLFLFAVAGLAAAGLTRILRGVEAARIPRIRAAHGASIAAALILLGFGAEYMNRPLRVDRLESGDAIPEVYRWLADQPDARIIELPIFIPDHHFEQRIAAREQYYSLAHYHRMVNGNANVLPKGYKALVLDMKRFPSDRSVALLQGLGVTHVVIHFDQMKGAERAAVTRQLDAGVAGLIPVRQFGDTSVFLVQRTAMLERLPALIPPGAAVRLSREDPLGTGAYMAMLGYLLRDHPLYARLRVDFGQDYVAGPDDGTQYEYAIFYAHENPADAGFVNAEVIWRDNVAVVYRKRPT